MIVKSHPAMVGSRLAPWRNVHGRSQRGHHREFLDQISVAFGGTGWISGSPDKAGANRGKRPRDCTVTCGSRSGRARRCGCGPSMSESDSYAALAAAAGVDVIALGEVRSSDLAVRLVPERLARRHSIVPLEVDNRVLDVRHLPALQPRGRERSGVRIGTANHFQGRHAIVGRGGA